MPNGHSTLGGVKTVNQYKINEQYPNAIQYTVKAAQVVTRGDFIDFEDGGGLVFRIQADKVLTITRQDGQ